MFVTRETFINLTTLTGTPIHVFLPFIGISQIP